MSDDQSADDKQHEPTQKRLDDARKKGEIAKSVDLNTAAAYAGFALAAFVLGAGSLKGLGEIGMVLLGQADRIAPLMLEGHGAAPVAGLMGSVALDLWPWAVVPGVIVLVTVLAQRSLVVAPERIQPKLSKISIIGNAKNKFGRSGLFEFAKSGLKLTVYALLLAFYLSSHIQEMIGTMHLSPPMAAAHLTRMAAEFMAVVVAIAGAIAAVDYLWQVSEHMRKNRMSHEELKEEHKQAEGDPHVKQQRRQRAMDIATNRMLQDVPKADVVIVNPTHYAVALKWNRASPGAPVCVAKGVDEIAMRIREIATEEGIPMRRDPPTARALYATVEIGDQILPEHYRAVAAAIRFAEDMRRRARGRP